MSKKLNRREAQKLLLAGAALSVWTKPIVKAVVLPVHATTSVCSSNNMLGTWRLEVFDRGYPFERIVTFLAGGATNISFVDYWEVVNGVVTIRQDVSDWIFTGGFNDTCNEIRGTYVLNTQNSIDPIPPAPQTGTWKATKL